MSVVSYIRVILILTFVVNSKSARILAFFPTPSYSHHLVFRPFVEELAKHGHEVVVVTPNPAYTKHQAPKNVKEIDVHDLSYNYIMENDVPRNISTFELLTQGYVICYEVFIKQILTDEVQEVIKDKNNKFDLLLAEAWLRPVLVLSHVLKVPVIQVSSYSAMLGNYEVVGAPVHPFLYPNNLHQRIHNLTFWEKAVELFNHYRFLIWYYYLEEYENELLRQFFGDDVPSVSELNNNVDMLFLNIHPFWEGNRPIPPNVIHMGGLHLKPTRELPKDLKSYLDSSTNGVIYISFGTNISPSHLPPEMIAMFVKVLSGLSYNVLWKWDDDELPGRSENIKISKWLPQADLLRHPKIKLFITQGGLQSTDEAIAAGVPLIGIPMIGDQWFNTEKYIYYKIGTQLDIVTLTEEQLRGTISDIIGDKSYRENIIRLRTLMRDQPQSPLERAVWWTEYVIRHGGAHHLRSPAANISWAEFLELKFVGTLLALLFPIAAVIFTILYYVLRDKIWSGLIVGAKVKTS